MPHLPHPTASGAYRIGVYRYSDPKSSSAAFLKHVHTGNVHWIQLSPLTHSDSDAKFKWRLDRVSGTTDVYTIRPSSDLWIGMVPSLGQASSDKPYGTVEGRWASAANWRIQKSQDGLYSRIMNESATLALDCRDEAENRRVHLQDVQDGLNATNQRYVFEPLDDVVGLDTTTSIGGGGDAYKDGDQETLSDFHQSTRGTQLSSGLSSPSDVPSDWGITSPTSTSGRMGRDEDDGESSTSFTRRRRRTSLSSDNTSLADHPSRQRMSGSASTSNLSFTSRWEDTSNAGNTNSSAKYSSARPSLQPDPPSFTLEAAAREAYDIIIVGGSLGANVLAADLFSTNIKLGPGGSKNVLVIDNGPIPSETPFHSHYFNASPYACHSATRIDSSTLQTELGSPLYTELSRKWYAEAEQLMGVSLPPTNALQLGIMERLDMECGGRDGEWGCRWGWARSASRSPSDRLSEIARGRKRDPTTFKPIEHSNFKTLLGTEVRSIEWGDGQSGKAVATGVVVRDRQGGRDSETTIHLSPNGIIVLGSGSFNSPAILLRSGLTVFLEEYGGLYLTSQDIWVRNTRTHYLDEGARKKAGPMMLQSYVHLRSGQVALVIISIEADSSGSSRASSGKLVSTYTLPLPLNPNNHLRLDFKDEPVLEGEVGTASRYTRVDRDRDLAELRDFDQVARKVLTEMLHINIHGDTDPDEDDDYFTPLDLGSLGQGHGVGTIPLKCSSFGRITSLQPYCLEQNLQLRGHSNIFVCDHSLLPFSPSVDPSLTIAALALRLSRTIHPREQEIDLSTSSYQDQLDSKRSVVVVNHTGERIKVRVSNIAGVRVGEDEMRDKGERILGPGERAVRLRKKGVDEVVMVYRLEEGKRSENERFGTRPVAYVTTPGYETRCIVE